MPEQTRFIQGDRVCSFSRANEFILNQPTEEQLNLAQAYAIQCTAMGWPANFIEPQRLRGSILLPVLHFYQAGLSGEVRYKVTGYESADTPLASPEDSPDSIEESQSDLAEG